MSEKIEQEISEVKEQDKSIEENSALAQNEEIEHYETKKVSKIENLKSKFNDEVDEYNKDENKFSDKYAKLSLNNFHIIIACLASSLVLLYTPFSFKFVSQLIGLFFLVFAVSSLLIVKYYINNKEDKEVRLDIYEACQKGVLSLILVNFGLYAFSTNPHDEMLVILGFAAIATIIIQKGVNRSL
jgi:hypothetical protein